MNRRTTVIIAVIAAVVVFSTMPALAQEADSAERPDRSKHVYPPAWVNQTVDEIRERIADRTAMAEERIASSDRLTDQQKAQALANLTEATDVVAAAGEPAEIVGIATSRAQLQRIAWRAERRGETPDYEVHITRDLVRDMRRYDHLVTITGWADAAGVDVSAVNGNLAQASEQLGVAEGGGTVEQRHDAVHIARAWVVLAYTTLMGE